LDKQDRILFIPELELDPRQVPRDVTVKGQSPRLDYPFALWDIYPTVAALDGRRAYQRIRAEFARINALLADKLKLRPSVHLPPVADESQAAYLLGILFDPTIYHTDGLWQRLSPLAGVHTGPLQLDDAQPFPLRLASPQKLVHTLGWIDANVKVTVESLTAPYDVPAPAVRQIVESALKIYSYLVKQRDYYLARSINFNHSMFLQDRILNLLLGDSICMAADRLGGSGKLANQIAMELLRNLDTLSYRQLCALSVFMGVIWTSSQDVQRAFAANPSLTLGHIETQLNTQAGNWCIDHTDRFLADMGTEAPITVCVILDDNGESVFDVALFQRLLNDSGSLRVVLIVNRYPVSNNIALETLQDLLRDPFFQDLRRHLEQGRAGLCVERQVFRSFELAHLQPETVHLIRQSQATYIKGVNFFETCQIPDITRYYCFTVHGRTSTMLTGCAEGKGVFVKLRPGETGYTYHSPDRIETLRAKVARGEPGTHAI
jgi:hypothetical protein